MTLKKIDLIEALVEKFDVKKIEAKGLVEALFLQIKQTLVEGNSLTILGLGKFSVKEKKARPGQDFHTGKEVQISKRRVVRFKAVAKKRALSE